MKNLKKLFCFGTKWTYIWNVLISYGTFDIYIRKCGIQYLNENYLFFFETKSINLGTKSIFITPLITSKQIHPFFIKHF